METVEILRKLVEFNTIEDKENKKIINWLKDYLNNEEFKCDIITDEKTKKSCLIAQYGDNPIIGFSGHLDTVNATEEWTKDPFKLTEEGSKLYGLGVCDMKSGIAAILKACSNIKEKNIKRGIKLFFTYDEENGFSGINLLLKEKIEFPQHMILVEPTDLKPVSATKGCIEMKATFIGQSSHSSTPNKGKNAIIDATKFIGELLDFAEELKKEQNPLFPIPYTTMNIGKIKGGDAINKVPDKCCVEFDARPINELHNKMIETEIKNILKKYNSKFEIGLNIQANINRNYSMISEIESITGKEQESGNYVTEASFIKNSETIIIGAGPITAHQSDEYIEVEKLNKTVEIYSKIIEKYCM